MTHHNISASTLARTAALALALTNQVLSAVGKPILPIESAQLEQLISSGLTVAAALGVRSGACFHVIWNQEREKAGLDQIENDDTGSAVRVAVEALRRLIREDRAKL